ncbi:MAG: excinuclease ABC subunit UvrB [Candidatus Omnitrophota bacterium]
MEKFKLVSGFKPCGDQPKAIKELTEGLKKGVRSQTLLGVTGSGKTFTLANVIEDINRPTLVISHNKTLAAQLYSEFKEFFPENRVEYFVSYYDYYQPEAYIPVTDTYIEKDASINDRLDALRLSATSSLMSRKDVLIVASVSCIYNLGSPSDYRDFILLIESGETLDRDEVLKKLVSIQYERNDLDFSRGKFRVRGDVVEVFPANQDTAVRLNFSGNTLKEICEIHPLSGQVLTKTRHAAIYPAKHFLVSAERIEGAFESIEAELDSRIEFLKKQSKLLEAQRLLSRTRYDMEMLREIGYCHGIENYSRHLSGRQPGERPYCLIDYFHKDPEWSNLKRESSGSRSNASKRNGIRDFLTIIDESHVTMPQIRGMYEGDRARKETLVEYGFRLPSCLDNRPLKFDEFEALIGDVIFVSATPAEYELKNSLNHVAEQIIRPTGLVDPEIVVRKTEGQIDDLIQEINNRAQLNERVLVTTLTKRMAEDLCNYLKEKGVAVRYIHSEIDTIERAKILKDLRLQKFDCLVGVNLLREGLDLPEVSLVAILDADKEGFLRSATSLIQVAGRTARNINGTVIMYADNITGSMKKAIEESSRRREVQIEFNRVNKITPRTIKKAIRDSIEMEEEAKGLTAEAAGLSKDELEFETIINELEEEMGLAARNLHFEQAAALRDKIKELKNIKIK